MECVSMCQCTNEPTISLMECVSMYHSIVERHSYLIEEINQAKSNYPTHTNGEETIQHRASVGLLFCTA